MPCSAVDLHFLLESSSISWGKTQDKTDKRRNRRSRPRNRSHGPSWTPWPSPGTANHVAMQKLSNTEQGEAECHFPFPWDPHHLHLPLPLPPIHEPIHIPIHPPLRTHAPPRTVLVKAAGLRYWTRRGAALRLVESSWICSSRACSEL